MASNKNALAMCDTCGFVYPHRVMKLNSYENADIPKRFLPPLTCGLSYYLSMKTPGTEMDRIGMLKSNYEALLQTALEEDRERANLFLKPKLGYI